MLAAAADSWLVNIVAAPGSGKTTVAAERFGYQRFRSGSRPGVLGLSFARAAVSEFRNRIAARWGSDCLTFPHEVMTFDHLHVTLTHALLEAGHIRWPGGHTALDVRDDYLGCKGFRRIEAGNFSRIAGLDSANAVISEGIRRRRPVNAIGGVKDHRAVLNAGVTTHEDVRAVLASALHVNDLRDFASAWLARNFRSVVIDEIYDAADLDLNVTLIAVQTGIAVTVLGDPWQALYGWRGATPDKVAMDLIQAAAAEFRSLPLSRSFRFKSAQMRQLSAQLRNGEPVSLPEISSTDVDVAIARNWGPLWQAGENVLPVAFRTIQNATDAALNLLLDVMTRAQLGRSSYGRDTAAITLGLDRSEIDERQKEVLEPVLTELREGLSLPEALERIRDAMRELGAKRRPSRLGEANEAKRIEDLRQLVLRLRRSDLVPGLTVFQAKGSEWSRVGVVLTVHDLALLAAGLRELDDDHCALYVALTRAEVACGRLVPSTEPTLEHMVEDPFPWWPGGN